MNWKHAVLAMILAPALSTAHAQTPAGAPAGLDTALLSLSFASVI